ncbi:MAG: nitric oxide reductase transcriptional regulator NorR [Proteobacteria bacterium]|uniref:nitric oxide reductase transcriptional regulator NorR n=1 Tax=Aquabacterium sp. TaxID=1872578 RepID=UPI0035C6F5D9|nr:nitric oxide reductase transcriptional regulator NorR [Pseudomonadota bacterium]
MTMAEVENTLCEAPIDHMGLADLSVTLPRAVRLQRLVGQLKARFACEAVVLLQEEGEALRPVAAVGLSREALGRAFEVAQHPRLSTILLGREVVHFEHASTLPDPYDGLVESMAGHPLPVHDCMGVSVHVDGRRWGVLTLDALRPGTFDASARAALRASLPWVAAAVRVSLLEQEVQVLRQARVTASGGEGGVGAPMPGVRTGIIGHSAALQQVLHEVDVVAQSDLPVLLMGETGTGKELFAQRVHERSARAKGPMVHVNCAALPESLAESELFGHVRGAFSGATTDRAGRFEAARGGTIFLDEVGELPLSIQAKLLRTLQNGEVQRLGADKPVKVDVRVVAATNRLLKDAVSQGVFRADLYHRLSVYPIHVPPLRERGDDVLLLAGHFLEVNRARLGLRSLRLDAGAESALLRYGWPGNVRELEHVMGRAALKLLSRGVNRRDIVTLTEDVLDLAETPGASLGLAGLASAGDAVPSSAGASAGPAMAGLRAQVEQFERGLVRQALQAAGGNWAEAARWLGIDASNLHKLAKRLGVK